MKLTAFVLVTAVCGIGAASAQSTGNPAGLSPDTPGVEKGTPVPDHANTQDRLFVRQALLGGRAEVDASTLAQLKSSNQGVKTFAQQMIDDHTKSNDRLGRAAKPLKPELPKDLDPEHRSVHSELERLSGADFDARYLATQVSEHQKTANLLAWHLSYGQNEGLRTFSAQTLPTVLMHLEHAVQLQAKLSNERR